MQTRPLNRHLLSKCYLSLQVQWANPQLLLSCATMEIKAYRIDDIHKENYLLPVKSLVKVIQRDMVHIQNSLYSSCKASCILRSKKTSDLLLNNSRTVDQILADPLYHAKRSQSSHAGFTTSIKLLVRFLLFFLWFLRLAHTVFVTVCNFAGSVWKATSEVSSQQI